MTGITLEGLFRFQDDAAAHNTANSVRLRRLLDFVRESVGLLAHTLGSMRFSAHKQHTLRVLGADAVTGIVTSVRVGLWGNLPEAAALLRSSLETTAIFSAVVQENRYESIATEVFAARLKRHSYEKSVTQLGELGSRINYLRARLSEVGAHSTGTRLKFASYRLDGQVFDRIGAALDPESAELALSMAPDVCLQLLEACEKAYAQDRLEFPDPAGLAELRAGFADCKESPDTGAA
jgi:hypothetical protein